jgi:hypothetical protein
MNGKITTSPTLLRVLLMKCEAYRVAAKYRALRVRSGRAWVTLNGRDLVLKRGQEIALESKKDFAVVSTLGGRPLVIELLGETPRLAAFNPRRTVSAL